MHHADTEVRLAVHLELLLGGQAGLDAGPQLCGEPFDAEPEPAVEPGFGEMGEPVGFDRELEERARYLARVVEHQLEVACVAERLDPGGGGTLIDQRVPGDHVGQDREAGAREERDDAERQGDPGAEPQRATRRGSSDSHVLSVTRSSTMGGHRCR
jgi:hypothetical protein